MALFSTKIESISILDSQKFSDAVEQFVQLRHAAMIDRHHHTDAQHYLPIPISMNGLKTFGTVSAVQSSKGTYTLQGAEIFVKFVPTKELSCIFRLSTYSTLPVRHAMFRVRITSDSPSNDIPLSFDVIDTFLFWS